MSSIARQPFGGTLLRRGIAAAIATTVVVLQFSGTRAAQDQPLGLQGLLPETAPVDIDFEAFSCLVGNWAEWSEETSTMVGQLYGEELASLDVAGQRDLLQKLQSRLKVMQTALRVRAYRSIYETLIGLHGSLERRVAVALAALDTLQLDKSAVAAERLEQARQAVLAAAEDLSQMLNDYRNGEAWIGYVRLNELQVSFAEIESARQAASLARSVADKIVAGGQLADEQQRKFLSRDEFAALASALDEHASAIESESQPVDEARLREALARLIQSIEVYEDDSTSEAARTVRAAFSELRELAADGGRRMGAALREHYFNYNLKIVGAERFLSRMMSEQMNESSRVNEYVMGASVYGNQYTTASTGVNLKPSGDGARFDVTLSGTVHSNTAGVSGHVTAYTQGYHRFWASKAATFDGHNFKTEPARISVDANNRTVDVDVKGGWVPIIGWIAQGIAESEVRRRQPQAEAITRSRIAERVLPDLNKEVDTSLTTAETDLETGFYQRLRETGLYPESTSIKTTDDYLWMNHRVWGDGELAASTPDYTRNQPGGLTVHVHETWLNHMLDQLGFAGRTMSEGQVRSELGQYFSKLLNKEVSFAKEGDQLADEGPDTFVFARQDALRVQIEQGQVLVIMRAAFKQEGKDDIPEQKVTVPLAYHIEGDEIVIDRGTVIVEPTAEPESRAEQIARAGIIRKKLESSIPNRRRSRTVYVQREGRDDFPVQLTRFTALNGWLTVWGE